MDYKELDREIKSGVFRTERLIIRPFCDRDADGLLELFQDKYTMEMDGDHPIAEKNEEFDRRINLIKNGPLIWFFSEEIISSEFVGYMMLQDETEAVALGFAITAAKQHMGYGYEMLRAVVNVLYEKGVKEIRIKTREKNLPCQKLAEKLGFERIRVIKGNQKDTMTGKTDDSYLYSLKKK